MRTDAPGRPLLHRKDVAVRGVDTWHRLAVGYCRRMNIGIRAPLESEHSQWSVLWKSYLDFYQTELPPGQADTLWERILNAESAIDCRVAEQDGHLIGLVHFLAHDDTWANGQICYLQDLYVDKSHRGEGIGKKLIESVVAEAGRSGWSSVYWLTADDNLQARVLYDGLTGGTSGFIHYEIDVTEE